MHRRGATVDTEGVRRPPERTGPGRLVGLAVDLDRTLVAPGRRPNRTARLALQEARGMGLKVILVSGRIRTDLPPFIDALGAIDAVVGENGAVIEAPLGDRPEILGRAMAARVHGRLRSAPRLDVEWGEVVASVPRRQRGRLVPLLRGLPVQYTENVDRVMVLPKEITKATGVRGALAHLGLGGGAYAAIGDGENDVAMLEDAAFSGCVANATRPARAASTVACSGRYARGVAEFVHGPLRAFQTG